MSQATPSVRVFSEPSPNRQAAGPCYCLPAECRRQAEAFLAEGSYYGWQLQTVASRSIGEFTECTLDFDGGRIVFLQRTGPQSV